jgi:phosphatidyl-myo-inositol dimannoside synthase
MNSSEGRDLLLTYDFPPMGGGIARFMAELGRRYPAPGLVVSTGAVPGAAGADAAAGCPVDRLPVPAGRLRNLTGLLRWNRRAAWLAARHGSRFVWAGNLRPAATPAARAARATGGRYGVILHGADLVSLERKAARSAWKRRVARADLGRAAWLVANSGWTAALAARVGGGLGREDAAARIVAVPLGSDPAVFHPGVDPAPARALLGPGPARWLLTVARLVPHKGIDTALGVLAALAPAFADLGYAVAGDGPDLDRLRARAAALGVAGRVRFLGPVPDALLPPLYAAAEVYLGLSREDGLGAEGFGIALADAAAAGLPVVAGRSGGTADAVRHGETGWRVDPADPAEAVDAVGALLRDPERARALGRAGRALAEAELNWDRVARRLVELSRRGAATAGRG